MPFRVDADAAPVAVGRAEQPGRVEPAGFGVIGIHVRDGIGFGVDQRFGSGDIGQDVAGLEIDDAAEPGDQMRAR